MAEERARRPRSRTLPTVRFDLDPGRRFAGEYQDAEEPRSVEVLLSVRVPKTLPSLSPLLKSVTMTMTETKWGG